MAKFVPNLAWPGEVVRSIELRARVRDAGEEMFARARANAAESADTGDFLASLEFSTGRYSTGRPYARVSSSAEGALAIEFGSSDTPAHRALGRAARSM